MLEVGDKVRIKNVVGNCWVTPHNELRHYEGSDLCIWEVLFVAGNFPRMGDCGKVTGGNDLMVARKREVDRIVLFTCASQVELIAPVCTSCGKPVVEKCDKCGTPKQEADHVEAG